MYVPPSLPYCACTYLARGWRAERLPFPESHHSIDPLDPILPLVASGGVGGPGATMPPRRIFPGSDAPPPEPQHSRRESRLVPAIPRHGPRIAGPLLPGARKLPVPPGATTYEPVWPPCAQPGLRDTRHVARPAGCTRRPCCGRLGSALTRY